MDKGQLRFRIICLFAVAFAFLFVCPRSYAGAIGPYPDPRYYRTGHAGPYTNVVTGTGGLVSSIPLIHLKGLGNTSIVIDMNFRSNNADGSFFTAGPYCPGAGWFITALRNVHYGYGGQRTITENVGNTAFNTTYDTVNYWDASYNPPAISATPDAGTRAQMQVLTSSGGTVTGFVEQDEKTLNTYSYLYNGTPNALQPSWFYLSTARTSGGTR